MKTAQQITELQQLLSRIQQGDLRRDLVERRRILSRASGLLAFNPMHQGNAMGAADILGRPGFSSSMYESMEARMESILGQAITELETSAHVTAIAPLQTIELICDRFHTVCRQLRNRHDHRPTLDVQDEYDVQDLLHALLLIHFADIRPEEWTPSYAGKSARMDFLLKQEQTIIETKNARRGLGAREIGDQLIVDIARYRTHPDCKTLVCFVYDPSGLIANPKGIENDLRQIDDCLRVEVFVRP